MKLTPYKTRKLFPPEDNLYDALKAAKLNIEEGDVIAVSSKVVSIGEARCILNDETLTRDELAKHESARYVERPVAGRHLPLFTLTRGVLINVAGIDESNANGYFVLYPKNPMKSAEEIRAWIRKTFKVKKVGVIITDSKSVPVRRGAVGFALGWAGVEPLKNYRKEKDIFGRAFKTEVANIIDGLAGAAVVAMGEGNEQTPAVVIRGAPIAFTDKKRPQERFMKVTLENDLFSSFLLKRKWKRGDGC